MTLLMVPAAVPAQRVFAADLAGMRGSAYQDCVNLATNDPPASRQTVSVVLNLHTVPPPPPPPSALAAE